jgi:hypothetical protein
MTAKRLRYALVVTMPKVEPVSLMSPPRSMQRFSRCPAGYWADLTHQHQAFGIAENRSGSYKIAALVAGERYHLSPHRTDLRYSFRFYA